VIRGWLAAWRRWREHASVRRAAERALDRLFQDNSVLAGTSLRPDHRPRCQLLDLSAAPGRIGFGVVRHPRPYPFSRQRHEVIELWLWTADERRLERVRGINVTRARLDDDAGSSFSPPP
jgi:hypothetical protein